MRRWRVSIFCLCWAAAFLVWMAQRGMAQQGQGASAETENIPPGMELIQVTGGYRLIVPEGAKIRRVGAQIIVEGDKEYYSRRFFELSQELDHLKTQMEELKQHVQQIKVHAQKGQD